MSNNIDKTMDNNIENREKIFSEIAKKYGIRAVKPEYHIILNVLQSNSPTTIKELQDEINSDYDFEMFTYKQLYSNVKALSELKIIKNNNLTKQISINPEYISYPEGLSIPFYMMYIFSVSAIFMIISFATKTMMIVSLSIFLVGILYIIAQHYGSKFNLKL